MKRQQDATEDTLLSSFIKLEVLVCYQKEQGTFLLWVKKIRTPLIVDSRDDAEDAVMNSLSGSLMSANLTELTKNIRFKIPENT